MAFQELQFNAPKIKSPFEIEAGYQQIQQGQNQNKLAQMQFQEADRVNTERNALSGLAKQHGNNPEAYRGALMSGGFVKQAQDFDKYQTEQSKAARDAKKAQIEEHLQKFEITERVMRGVSDDQTWQAAKQELAAIYGPEAAAQMPQNYDPALIEQNRMKAMPLKEQLAQQWKELEYTTPSANAKLSAETSRANNAASRDVTMRGQDMTDARGRDLNATNVEENNIKREVKADTANLTKQSQVASFDTMIGTLERLGKHKGLPNATGMMNYLPDRKGSDVSNFKAELDTFQSQAFIPMVSQLKGMGALSDAEGKKLTAAVGALDVDRMSEKAVRESITRIIADMTAARNRVSGANNGTAPTGKTATNADIQATARATGKTVAQVTADLRAKGYQIK